MANKKNSSGTDMLLGGIGKKSETPNSNDRTMGRPVEDREKKVRKSIAILPSIFEDAQKITYVDRTSVSELIAELLSTYIEENQSKLKEYEKIKK